MSGINTVSGLRNVSIDYRPQVGPDAANAAGAQQQAPDEVPALDDNIINTGAHPQADKAKSIVRQLDTLKTKLKFVKFDGTTKTVKPGVKGIKDYLETSTPSLYKRDKFDKVFD